jgi:hypothetical protein
MFRFRTLVLLGLVIFLVYALAPPERKRRWLDKGREIVKALAISIVIYWIYMFIVYFVKR